MTKPTIIPETFILNRIIHQGYDEITFHANLHRFPRCNKGNCSAANHSRGIPEAAENFHLKET